MTLTTLRILQRIKSFGLPPRVVPRSLAVTILRIQPVWQQQATGFIPCLQGAMALPTELLQYRHRIRPMFSLVLVRSIEMRLAMVSTPALARWTLTWLQTQLTGVGFSIHRTSQARVSLLRVIEPIALMPQQSSGKMPDHVTAYI